MSRKNRTPEENERRAKIRELLQMGGISSMDDIQNFYHYYSHLFIPPRST